MSVNSEINVLNEENVNFLINELKKENNCLKTDLNKYKLLTNCYLKYFDYFNDLFETNDSNNEVLNELKNNIKVINECKNSCFVSLEKLNENQLNLIKSKIKLRTQERIQRGIAGNSNQLSAEELVSDDSEGIDCDINQSFDDSIDGSIDENNELFHNISEERNESSEEVLKPQYLLKKIKTEDISEEVSNESQTNGNQKPKKTSKRQSFGCDYTGCGRRFGNSRSLRIHKKLHLGVEYRCEWKDCSGVFTTKKYLNKHMAQHERADPCSTEGSQQSTTSSPKLSLHEKRRLNRKPVICLINNCNKEYKRPKDLRQHQETAHPFDMEDLSWIKCTENGCDFQTKSRKEYRRHEDKHTRPYKCTECDKTYTQKKSLEYHMNNHALEPTIPCEWPQCQRLFFNAEAVKAHMRVHTLKLANSCHWPGCEKAFKTEESLTNHIARHQRKSRTSEQQMICLINDCNKVFKKNQDLKEHQLKAHPHEHHDIPWIECTQSGCGFKTKSKIVYKLHEKKHTRPYVCQECGKGFQTSKNLKVHMTVHSSALKIPCEWYGCERLFNNSTQMKHHMNSHTLAITFTCPWPGCCKTFTTKPVFDNHVDRHKGKGCYRCSQCDYRSTNPIPYYNHLSKHQNNKI